jgi:NADPH-dependent 2,4-dienoyl-CoA reductase/sulfur reductase-like enzyme
MRSREEVLRSIECVSFDVCVIGGEATGAGCVLDAQLRGLKTVLVEAGDFALGHLNRSCTQRWCGPTLSQELMPVDLALEMGIREPDLTT